MVRIVLTSDNHLNAYYSRMSARQLQERRKRIRTAWREAVEYAIAHDCHMFLQAGDLFDMPDPRTTELVSAARDFKRLMEAGVRTFCIGGTHDMHRMTSDGVLALRIYQEVGLLRVFHRTLDPEPEVVDVEGIRIAVGGLSVDHRLTAEQDPLEGIEYQAEADFRILLLHYGVEGTIHPDANEPILKKDRLEQLGVDLLAIGHVHQHRKMLIGGTTVIIPGSTERHTFGELNTQPGFFYLELDKTGLRSVEHIDVVPQQMKELLIRATEIPEEDPTTYVLERVREASMPDQLMKCRLEGPLMRPVFHALRLREVFLAGSERNFYFDLDTRGLTVSDPMRLAPDDPGSVSISQKDEIQRVAKELLEQTEDEPDREILVEACNRVLSRYGTAE